MSERVEDGGPALLPCPFCGCTDVSSKDDGDYMWFECDWCHATSGYDPEADLEAPVYHWNRRYSAATIEDLTSSLRLALAALDDYTEWQERGMDVRDPPSLAWSKKIAVEGRGSLSRASTPSEPLNARTQGVEVGR